MIGQPLVYRLCAKCNRSQIVSESACGKLTMHAYFMLYVQRLVLNQCTVYHQRCTSTLPLSMSQNYVYILNVITSLYKYCSPMDFLIAPKHRWIYVAIFSVMAVSTFVTFSFFNSRDTSSQNIYFNLFLKLRKCLNDCIS